MSYNTYEFNSVLLNDILPFEEELGEYILSKEITDCSTGPSTRIFTVKLITKIPYITLLSYIKFLIQESDTVTTSAMLFFQESCPSLECKSPVSFKRINACDLSEAEIKKYEVSYKEVEEYSK